MGSVRGDGSLSVGTTGGSGVWIGSGVALTSTMGFGSRIGTGAPPVGTTGGRDGSFARGGS